MARTHDAAVSEKTMTDPKELRIRFDEAMRIYGDSPNVTVTYKDLARLYEDMTQLLELFGSSRIGFKPQEER